MQVFTRKYSLSLTTEAIAFLDNILDKHNIPDDEVQESLEHIAKAYMKRDGEFTYLVEDMDV